MEVLEIARQFDIAADPVSYKECGIGHINSTYFVKTSDGTYYVLQRINTNIFKDLDGLMNNIVRVTAHISEKLKAAGRDYKRGTLTFVKALSSDRYWYKTEDGNTWRMYVRVEGVTTLQFCDSPDVFKKVGFAFGNFQNQLADFDASKLVETIPDFHNTAKRFKTFLSSLKADKMGRAAGCSDAIRFVKEREEMCSSIVNGIADGKISLRVTHNDTKLNNLLLDEESLEPVCVIDLDTVMPGSVLYDFGDAIRSGAAMQPEDSMDYDKCGVNVDIFKAFADGFISSLGGALTEDEIRLFPLGARVITFETGMRFLTDYLDGDVYFRTEYPEHNLVRALNQFAMVADIEKKTPELDKIISSILHK